MPVSQLVTGWVQSIYYGIAIRAGDPKPQPGSPRYAEHRRRIHILVVTLYLLYTIYEADFELRRGGSFYTDLNLPLFATEREIKTRFRRLAALYHPDKVQPGAATADDANAYFVRLKLASDTLLDPARRFAYERFGPDVVEWQHCTTIRDYVERGAMMASGYYSVAAVAMYVLGFLGYLDWGRHERWVLLLVVAAFELHTVTRPSQPALFAHIVNPLVGLLAGRPPYLPFQAISLARKVCLTLYIAFSQIGPMLKANMAGGNVVGNDPKDREEAALKAVVENLETTARALDMDTSRLLEMEMAPFAGDPATVSTMQAKMKEWLVQNTIRADPMVKDALGRSLQKRRVDAPSGARGTR